MREGGHLSIAGALHAAVEHDLAMAFFFADVSPHPTVLACADRALTGPGRRGWNAHSTVAVGACTTVQARGNRMRLSALRAHTKVPYKPISYGKCLPKRALNRPWAARTVPQCSCSSSKAARASACSSQTQRSPTFGQPSRRPVIAAASHRGGRLRFLTQVPNRREPKRESSIERELKNSIEREIVPESEGSREERETSSLKIKSSPSPLHWCT